MKEEWLLQASNLAGANIEASQHRRGAGARRHQTGIHGETFSDSRGDSDSARNSSHRLGFRILALFSNTSVLKNVRSKRIFYGKHHKRDNFLLILEVVTPRRR